MGLNEYFRDWLRVIDKNKLMEVTSWLQRQDLSRICPAYHDIYKAFTMTTLRDCKVIFIGQDPYPQKGVATGLAFANSADTVNLSPSLEVIKEACIDPTIPHGPIEFDCTLESWAKQGVLLLNSSLTCELNKPNSHSLVWRGFTTKLLKNLSKETTGMIYVLMGKYAQSFEMWIDSRYNDIIKCGHPSYYARTETPMPDVFSQVNELLKGKYGTTIEWYKEFNNLNTNNDGSEESNSEFAFF